MIAIIIKTAICTVVIYSFILTIVNIYKDESSYHEADELDIFTSGIVMWVLLLFIKIFEKPLSNLYDKYKNRSYKAKNQKCIAKIVKKIIKNAKKDEDKREEYYSLNCYYSDFTVGWGGYSNFVVKKPKNERLNNAFIKLCMYQTKETINELKKYLIPVTEEIMKADECGEWFIRESKDKELYKIK